MSIVSSVGIPACVVVMTEVISDVTSTVASAVPARAIAFKGCSRSEHWREATNREYPGSSEIVPGFGQARKPDLPGTISIARCIRRASRDEARYCEKRGPR